MAGKAKKAPETVDFYRKLGSAFRLCTRIPVMVSPHDDELPAPFVEYPGAAKSLLLSSWVHLDRTKKRYFFFTSSSASNG
jgi:hypothetical protein